MKQNRKLKFGLLLLMLFLLFIPGCANKKLPASPEKYTIGDDSVSSIDKQLGKDDSLTAIKEIDNNKQKDEDDGGTGEVYTYDLKTPATTIQKYVEKLMGEDEGFVTVDKDGALTDLPSFKDTKGTVYLARESSVEDHLFEIEISWDKDSCKITISQPEGTLPQSKSTESQGKTETTDDPMTTDEAIQYFCSLDPANLGLKGNSMSDYMVMPTEGMVFVNNDACLKLSVYWKTKPQKTTNLAGIYFMSGDRIHIYRMNQYTNQVTEVNI